MSADEGGVARGASDLDSLSATQAEELDRACDHFEAAWRAGKRPRIEDHLEGIAEPLRSALLGELIAVELDWRRRCGERQAPTEYHDRFPAHATGVVSSSTVADTGHTACRPPSTPEATIEERSLGPGAGEDPGRAALPADEINGDRPVADPLVATAGSDSPPLVSTRSWPVIPGYLIEGELGRGGMGVVYKARSLRLNRIVALKMILAGEHAGHEAAVRFLAEAEAVAKVQHANIVQIFHLDQHGAYPFFEMEYVGGGSLADRLDGTPRQPLDAARLVETLARAMAEAHRQGIVHRDLKPSNILLTLEGTPKVTDFGLAKLLNVDSGLTRTDSVLGSPSYMAPEQTGGRTREVGPAADVYALGVILYELLTGRTPFRAATVFDTLQLVNTAEPVPPSRLIPRLPRDVETIALKCLNKDPARRYASSEALAEDLARFQAGESIRARRVGWPERTWRWCRRNRAVAGALSLGVLSLFVGSIVSLGFGFRMQAARESERRRAESEAGARRDADRARRDSQRQLVELSSANGLTAAREGDHSLALLWFARAAQLAKDDPQQETLNRVRIGNWLSQVWLPEGTFAIPGFKQKIDRFRAFQFSTDGKFLVVVASTGDCLVWDRLQAKLALLPEAATKSTAAAWRPRSNRLAVVDKTGRIRMLAAPDFRQVDEVAASGKIETLAFSRDGNRLAWGGAEGARVWDLVKKEYVTPLLPHPALVNALSFSTTAELLATSANDSKARVFRVPSDRAEPLFPPVPHVRPEDVYSHGGPDRIVPRFAADDRVVLTVEGDSVLVWRSATTGGLLGRTIEGAAFAVNEQGTRVASVLGEKGRLMDGRTRETLAPISFPTWNEHVIFSADGQTLVGCSSDTRVRFWSVEDRSGVTLVESHPNVYHPMSAVRVSLAPEGRHLATALWDGTVFLWRMPPGPPIAYKAYAGGSTVPQLSPDKKYVMPRGISYRSGNQLLTRVHDAQTGEPAGPILDPGGILLGAVFSPDGTLVATASSTGRTYDERNSRIFEPDGKSGSVQIWNWKTGQLLAGPVPMPGEPRGLTFRPDGSSIAVVCADYYVLLVDPRTGKITRRLDPGVRSRPNNANQYLANGDARFSPDGRFLVTSEMGSQAHVWDPDSGKLLHTLPHTERVHNVAFHPSVPELMVTSGLGSEVRVWNLSTGKLLAALKHPQWANCEPSFSPDGTALFTGAADGLLRCWDWQAGKLRDGYPLHATWLQNFHLTADQRWLVSQDGGAPPVLQVTDWATKTPASPRWKTQSTLSIDIPAGDDRAISGGFYPALVGYDLKAMRTPATDPIEDLTALAELAAGRRILSQGNIVPLNSAEWLERWENVRQKGPAAVRALHEVAPTSEAEGLAWRYTLEKPSADWMKEQFNDGEWKEGLAGFGVQFVPGDEVPHTEWKTADIWMRREVTLPKGDLGEMVLRVRHDDDVEVYLNGVLAMKRIGWTFAYDEFPIHAEARAALRAGKNALAVHCQQWWGGQYIDVGLAQLRPSAR
jgi:WD40 repeat protein/tRNA A-37 threonylcarbamoyl transferase component Bud32